MSNVLSSRRVFQPRKVYFPTVQDLKAGNKMEKRVLEEQIKNDILRVKLDKLKSF